MRKRPKHQRRVAATSPARAAPAASRPRVKLLAGAAVIGVAALLAYLPSLQGEFLLDDDDLVFDSALIRASDGLYRFWFTTQPVDYWPMTNSSFWIEWRLWGMSPTGYHVTNLVLHIASALLIWLILGKLSIPGAWLAALLFAVHPVNVESVAWIAQRKNTLSMLFFLLSIVWWIKAETGVGLRRERSAERRWYWLSLLAFVLAMLSKGSVVILPVVLLGLAWWQRGSITKQDLARTAPFFVVAMALAAVNVWFQTHGSGEELRSATFVQRLLGAGAVVWFYLYKALLPLNLTFIYPQWEIQVGDWRWWAPLAVGVVVTAVLLWQRHSRYGRPLLLAWLFFCVALLPVMGFTDVGFMKFSLVADHYQHIAIIGVVTLVAAGLSLLYQRAQGLARSAAIVTAAFVAVLLMFLSWQQSRLYADAITLYQATLAKNPRCWLLHNNFGSLLVEAGQSDKAIEHYQQALLLNPQYADAEYNYGNALLEIGRPEEAVEHYEQALRLRPKYVKAHKNLGGALTKLRRFQEAIDQYEQVLRLTPNSADAQSNLAAAWTLSGRLEEGIKHYRLALRLDPKSIDARYNMGIALMQSRQFQAAVDQYLQVLRLKPEYLPAYDKLALAYAQTGRLSEAVSTMRRALEMARSTGQTNMIPQIQGWLTFYEAGQKDSQGAPPQGEATSPSP